MSKASSGIQTAGDGQSFIPASRRADGTTRKEIKVRPGYKPPEDVETYKTRNAENWRTKSATVPGANVDAADEPDGEAKSKNAKRREATRKKKGAEENAQVDHALDTAVAGLQIHDASQATGHADSTEKSDQSTENAESFKKIRNHLKKLKAVQDLRSKKLAGERLSADQLIKISKEPEIIRDLVKLNYDGPEIQGDSIA